MASATPRQVVVGCIRKLAEAKNNSVSITPPWSLLQFLPPHSIPDFPLEKFVIWDTDETNLFLPTLVLVSVFIYQQKGGLELPGCTWEARALPSVPIGVAMTTLRALLDQGLREFEFGV